MATDTSLTELKLLNYKIQIVAARDPQRLLKTAHSCLPSPQIIAALFSSFDFD